MKKKTLAALLTAVSLLAALAACAPAGSTAPPAATPAGQPETQSPTATPAAEGDWAYVQANGKLYIGYTVYEPMNYTDNSGVFTGFDTEFATAVCEKLGVTPEFVEINWDTKVIELESKTIDCIWNGMTITDELLANLTISAPYVKNAQVVVIRAADAGKYTDTASLKAAALVAEASSAGEKEIAGEENLCQAPYTAVVKQTDALMEVKGMTSDAAVLDLTLANAVVGKGDYADLMLIDGLELSLEEYGIGFRKGSDVADQVNAAMAELVADGTLAALAEKYGLVLAGA